MFKKGDKVKVVSCEKPTYWYADQIGKTYTLCKYEYSFGWDAEGNERRYLKECDIELVKEEKEEMKFDMKEEPWFIRVANEQEYNAARYWVESLGFKFEYGNKYEGDIVAISNYLNSRGEVEPIIHKNKAEDDQSEYNEIKLNFKTIIDSVTFPEVKTEQQKQIEELEKTILLAKQQIETLKKGE